MKIQVPQAALFSFLISQLMAMFILSSAHADSIGIGCNTAAGVATNAAADCGAGDTATASGGESIALGQSQATNTFAISAGYEARATAVNSIAIGQNAQATGSEGTAVGAGAWGNARNASGFGVAARATATDATALGTGSTASHQNAVALGAGSTTNAANTVSVGTSGNRRRITNVAPGVNGTDSVNLNQLNALSNSAGAEVSGLNRRIDDVEDDSFEGIAAVTALTMIPPPAPGKEYSMGIGYGNYRGRDAVAFGMTRQFDDRIVLKAGISTSGGNSAAGAGFGFSF